MVFSTFLGLVQKTPILQSGPYLEKYFGGGGVDMNIHYWYSKIFKVKLNDFVYVI